MAESCADALADLGCRLVRGGWTPCLACRAERRSARDTRGPVSLRRGDAAWWCHACGTGGSARRLYQLAGSEPTRPLRPARAPVAEGDGWPDRWEVADLWERCRPVRAPVVAWLRTRALSPELLDRAIVGCLPAGALPSWAAHWRRLGEAAVLPLWSRAGEIRCLHARRVLAATEGPKSMGARGTGIRAGLVYATPAALRALRGETARTVIAEGEPDYLTHAQDGGSVIGIPGSGAWTAAHGRALRGEVLIRTHDDDAGHKYADAIAGSLAHAAYRRRERSTDGSA